MDGLGVWLAVWEARHEPDAHARRAASDAMAAIDAMLRELHALCSRLVNEIRAADDASATRADAMLARLRVIGDDRHRRLALWPPVSRLAPRKGHSGHSPKPILTSWAAWRGL